MKNLPFLFLAALLLLTGCKDDDPEPTDAVLRLKFQFDANQERLDNLGNPSTIPAGNAAQTPTFHGLSGHFIEMLSTELTPYQGGEQLYMGPEVPTSNSNSFGFTTGVDFDQAIVRNSGETFLEIPISSLNPGTYRHMRISVSYQNYDVRFNLTNIPTIGDLNDLSGRVASFLGYNQFINSVRVNNMDLAVNDAKLQGFWAVETDLPAPYTSFNQIVSGQAPENATTVVNPFPNNPVPAGSCVVSGSMDKDLVITGSETEDIELTLSFSINQSFEWEDINGNGMLDIDASNPNDTETIVDMGLRGLKVIVND